MTDFHDHLQAALVRAAGRPTRLRLARSPIPSVTAGTVGTAAAVVVSIAIAGVFLLTLSPAGAPEGQAQAGSGFLQIPLTRTSDGARVRLADFVGRPTLVSFTASWCGPCRANDARLALAAGRGLQTVVVPYRDTPEAVAATGPFSVATVATDDGGDRLFTELGGAGIPDSYLLDARGTIVESWHGALSNDDVERAVTLVTDP